MEKLGSSWHDGLNEPVNSDSYHVGDIASLKDTAADIASVSSMIPPLDLSTLHRIDNGNNYLATVFQVKFTSVHLN